MKILVTGVAGFIGFHLANRLLNSGHTIVGLDNLNDYYSPSLKKHRLNLLRKKFDIKKFYFIKADIEKKATFNKIFKKYNFNLVVHLAAQAGVRYSFDNPQKYINSNIIGFFNLLENIKKKRKTALIFASSSSVYGNIKKKIYSEDLNCNKPKQLYASTKLSNELMAYSYHDLYSLKVIGLRFFTVYGPFGRPDMSILKFTRKILNNEKVNLFNFGVHSRDFTYIDDIIEGILKAIIVLTKKKNSYFEIFNLGNNKPIKLMKLVKILSKYLNLTPKINFLIRQKGDMLETKASILKAKKELGYSPKIDIDVGLKKFIDWYKKFYI